MLTPDDYQEAVDMLALEFGWKRAPGDTLLWLDADEGVMVANWFYDVPSLHALMLQHTSGYYETRQGSSDHCIVIGIQDHKKICFEPTVVVYLRDHETKDKAFAYAIIVAVHRGLRNIKAVDAFLEKREKRNGS
jgi:hypothetical protein